VNSIVACCHSAKLCAYAARDFLSQQHQTYSLHIAAVVFAQTVKKLVLLQVQVRYPEMVALLFVHTWEEVLLNIFVSEVLFYRLFISV